MDITTLISLLVRVRLCIPFTCTSIRDELQNTIDMLKQQAYPRVQYAEVVPMETEQLVNNESTEIEDDQQN